MKRYKPISISLNGDDISLVTNFGTTHVLHYRNRLGYVEVIETMDAIFLTFKSRIKVIDKNSSRYNSKISSIKYARKFQKEISDNTYSITQIRMVDMVHRRNDESVDVFLKRAMDENLGKIIYR